MISALPVWYDAFQVGALDVDRATGAATFGYDRRWLASRNAFPISVTMPLGDRPHADPIVRPWLANLLPEEQALAGVARALGHDPSDSVAILAGIGGDTAGALSFGEAADPADWRYKGLVDVYASSGSDDDGSRSEEEAALAAHVRDLTRRPFLAGEDGVRQSLAGGQSKSALAILDPDGQPVLRTPRPDDTLALPLAGAPSTVIVKPSNPNLPGIVENEAYCLTLAAAIGLPAAETAICRAGDGNVLVVLRYDRRIGRGGRPMRIHQEDFAQANGVYPAYKYERGSVPGPSLATILATGRLVPPTDRLALLDQVIFNILVANSDAHAKNYSLILTGRPTLAPLYDVSTVLPWSHVNQYFAQNIAGKKRKPGDIARRHWTRLAAESGFSAGQTRSRVAALVDAMVAARPSAVARVAGQEGAKAEIVERVAGMIEVNALRILGRLNDPN
ncbi:MAG: type II toxin-antitoxin system HipA family toxin [Azospirillaceae bacterium]